MKYILSCLALFCAMGFSSAAGAATWYEVRSSHFVLKTDASEAVARDTVEKLERYRFVLGQLVGLDLSDDKEPPLVLYGFKNESEYLSASGLRGTLGFYKDDLSGPFAMLSLEERKRRGDPDGLEVIFHEYNHHLLTRYSPYHYPHWYSEGFAEYTSTMQFDGERAVLGMPVLMRFYALRELRQWMPLQDLMRAKSLVDDRFYPAYGSPMSYAQGWLTTHFMLHDPAYTKKLLDYLKLLNTNGVSEQEAFDKVFAMDRYALNVEIHQYWGSRKLPYLVYDFTGRMPKADIQIHKMSAAEAKVTVWEAEYMAGQHNLKYWQDQTRRKLDRALEEGVRPAVMHLYLAKQAVATKSWRLAFDEIDAAIAADSGFAEAYTLKGDSLWDQAKARGTVAADLPAIRAAYVAAIKANNRYIPGLQGYCKLALEDGQTVTPGILKVIASALYLAPGNDDLQKLEADLMVKAGKLDDAKAELTQLAEWSYRKQDYNDYKDKLAHVKELQSAGAR